MPRRAVPPAADVDHVLRPLRAIATKIRRDQAERIRLVHAAAAADPRPTNRQIGDALDIDEKAVRKILAAP